MVLKEGRVRHLMFSIALFLAVAPASAQGLVTQGPAVEGLAVEDLADVAQPPWLGRVRRPGRDGRIDGLIKGALFGALVSVVLERGHGDGKQLGPSDWACLVAYGAATGWVIDALQDRDLALRRGSSPPGVRFRVRF